MMRSIYHDDVFIILLLTGDVDSHEFARERE